VIEGEDRSDYLSLLRRLVSRDAKPYDIGRELWSLSMERVDPSGDWIYFPSWLLWGALTDRVELKPAEAHDAEADMVDAAREFLEVHGDPPSERAYFDRWLYERIGLERPSTSG
jgi:hypothetical protein